jgi:asparagine synthase (glutamine-hydrolysing)
MCGIAAIVHDDPRDVAHFIEKMTDALYHRGPDDSGTAILNGGSVALGMRRLSVIDLEGGHQPMWSEARDVCLVFNGEIYNFAELRRELVGRGHAFHTDHSDTEVIVHGFEEWRYDLFRRLNGMFAIALWDDRSKQLVVARDRTGEKPLYFAKIPNGYLVCSEVKGLLTHPALRRDIDPEALEEYLAFDYALGPKTLLSNVKKLGAGEYAAITPERVTTSAFWQPSFAKVERSESELLDEFHSLLDDSVRARMVADVPVGLFLSGGLDSTTVGYFMRRHSDDVHSFSIGFDDVDFDESGHARTAANALGTAHHVEVFSQEKLRELVPRIADILDEPMGDQSIFPTYLLSTFTRKQVKVALGGDGSDELFMGYNAYRPLKVAWMLDAVPLAARAVVASTARRLPSHVGSLPLRGVQFARTLAETPPQRLLNHLGSYKGNARWILSDGLNGSLPRTFEPGRHLVNGYGALGAADQTVAAYLRGYLQEDILVKVDRASMAASLEVRAPFLDPALIDFANSIPPQWKLHGFTGKYLLRRLMRGRVPDEVIDRPKVGFGVPLNRWLRESLAPMVTDYLSPQRLARDGYFDVPAVKTIVAEHLTGRRDHGHKIWLLLQFELWRERWVT